MESRSDKPLKLKFQTQTNLSFYFNTPCSAAVGNSKPHALRWKIFLPAQEPDTETKTLKDLNAFLVPTDLRKPCHACFLGILTLQLFPCSILPLSALAVAKKVQSGIFITNFPFQIYNNQSKYSTKQKRSVSLPGSATKPGPGRQKVGDVPGEQLRLLMEHPTLGYNQISVEHPRLSNWGSRQLCQSQERGETCVWEQPQNPTAMAHALCHSPWASQ